MTVTLQRVERERRGEELSVEARKIVNGAALATRRRGLPAGATALVLGSLYGVSQAVGFRPGVEFKVPLARSGVKIKTVPARRGNRGLNLDARRGSTLIPRRPSRKPP